MIAEADALDDVKQRVADRFQHLDLQLATVEERAGILGRLLRDRDIEASDDVVRTYVRAHRRWPDLLRAVERDLVEKGELDPHVSAATATISVAELNEAREGTGEPDFGLKPYFARGRCTMLAGHPGVAGKSTLARHYAAAKTRGEPFLGQAQRRGDVLWIGPDESKDDLRYHFTELDVPGERIHVWAQGLPTIDQIAQAAAGLDVVLVVIDTVPKIADAPAEASNTGWNRWARRALPLIHQSEAEWCVIHHTRQGSGTQLREIRGVSGIYAAVDIAVILRRGGATETSRIVSVPKTRYAGPERWPDDLVIDLDSDGYEVVEQQEPDRDSGGVHERAERVLKVVDDDPRSLDEIQSALEEAGESIPGPTLRTYLNRLYNAGKLERTGRGVRNDPHKWHA